MRSVSGLLAVEPGFAPDGVLTLRLWAGGTTLLDRHAPPSRIAAATRFYDDVLTRARAVPGVTAAAAVTTLPLGGDVDGFGLHIVGRPTANPQDAPTADRFVVTPDYFATLRIPLRRGRLLDEPRHTAGAADGGHQRARRGERCSPTRIPSVTRSSSADPTAPPRTIVGVVGDVRHHALDRPLQPQVYVMQSQWAWAETLMTLMVRTTGDPAALAGALRGVIREVDAGAAGDRHPPLCRRHRHEPPAPGASSPARSAIFAALALVLAVVGLYGALSVSVAQRRMEIGIRLAMGASAESIAGMVFLNGLRPVVLGLAVGSVAAVFALRAMGELVFDVRPLDPTALGVAMGALLVAGACACVLPAWRAARIDPALALRAE